MYKIGMTIGVIMMCGAVVMLIKSKRAKGDLLAGACMIVVIAIAVSEII